MSKANERKMSPMPVITVTHEQAKKNNLGTFVPHNDCKNDKEIIDSVRKRLKK